MMPSCSLFSCSGDVSLGWAFGCSRTGASHLSKNQPCDDAYALFCGSSSGSPYITVAVADGHGDMRSDLSRIGAFLAVEAASEELQSFHRLHTENIPRSSLRADFRADFPRRVTRRWRDLVEQDMRHRSGTPGAGEHTGIPDYFRYGTTLIGSLILSDAILIGQIGDGDIVLIRPDGTMECPIPRDPALVGMETRSLSARDAHLLLRTATLDRGDGGVLMAATDGVSDSFDGIEGEEFYTFIRSLAGRIRDYGVESVVGSMAGWLDRYSALASGDDMTLVFVCINPVERSEPPTRNGNAIRQALEGW